MANEYGCSDRLYEIIVNGTRFERGDMLTAIAKLGPKRVRFLDGPCPSNQENRGTADMLVKWELDGKRATVGEICRAAGMVAPAKGRGQTKERAA